MWVNLNKPGATDSPHTVRMMTVQQIERGIAMRKYSWRKPTQQIADESGVNVETINRVLRGQPVSKESYAKLTTYLRTPAGPAAMINNRDALAPYNSDRHPMMRSVMRLTGMAINYGILCRSRVSCNALTEGELLCYYYRLDYRVKECLLRDPQWSDEIKGKYLIPDTLEAWEWAERLGRLAERHRTLSSNPRHQPASQPSTSATHIPFTFPNGHSR